VEAAARGSGRGGRRQQSSLAAQQSGTPASINKHSKEITMDCTRTDHGRKAKLKKLVKSGSYPAGFTLSFYSEPGTTNHVEYATSLTPPSSTWTELAGTAIVTGATLTVANTTLPGSPRFYRVRIDP
jgi:hypothetical protein